MFQVALVLAALGCGADVEDGDGPGADRPADDPYLCTTSNAGLNLCTNYFAHASAEQRQQLVDQLVCRLEPCSETRPEVCGDRQGVNECRDVRALGRCDVAGGSAMGLESIELINTQQVFYDATALRGVLILYTRDDAVKNCQDLGGEWFDRYSPP